MAKTYKILERDPYLADFSGDIELRMNRYRETKKRLLGKEKKISSFANGNLYYGFHPVSYTHLDVYKRQVCKRARGEEDPLLRAGGRL